MHGLLPNFGETGVLGQVRDVAVHLSVHLDVLHHLGPVRLEAAVHVVQFDARNLAGRPVIQLGGQVLGEGVILAVLFPAAYKVVSLFPDHAHHLGDFLRGILQIGVHGNHNIPLGSGEAFEEGGRFAIVAAEADAMHGGAGHLLDNVPGAVGGAVVHEDNLVGEVLEGGIYPGLQFRQALGLVKEGNNK